MGRWWRQYWPWLIALAWLAGYELYAVFTPARTLSELYWTAQDGNAWLPFVVVGAVVILLIHFVFKKWRRWGR